MMRMIRFCARLRAGRDGATAVEFAFAGPLLFIAVLGVFEVAMILFVTSTMEGAVRDAVRFGVTGGVPAGTTREDHIRQIIAQRTVGLVDINVAGITTLVYDNFDEIGLAEPFTDAPPLNGVYDAGEFYDDLNSNGQWDDDRGTPGLGGADDVVVYIVTYDLPLITGFLSHLIGGGGHISLRAATVARNEPYDDGTGS